jgi:hypothetical protein
MNPVLQRTAVAGCLVLLALTGCSSETPTNNASPKPSASSTRPAVVAPVKVPTPLAACPRITGASLATAVPGTTFADTALALKHGMCSALVHSTSGPELLQVDISATATGKTAVDGLRAHPPKVPGAAVLRDLGVGVPSSGVTFPNGKTRTYLLEAATGQRLVSLQVALTPVTVANQTPQETGQALLAWALGLRS